MSPDELEKLRRRLYSPGGDSRKAIADYVAASSKTEVSVAPHGDDESVAAEHRINGSAKRENRRRPRVLTGTLVGCAVLIGIIAVALWLHNGRTKLPDRVAPPSSEGATLLYYSRVANPQSAPDKVTFEPADERMVFRADGHRLAVALQCVGTGEVRITVAEHPFYFRCGAQLTTTVQRTKEAVEGPFFIFGRTKGNPVWGLRVTSLPSGRP